MSQLTVRVAMSANLVEITAKIRELFRSGCVGYRKPHIENEKAHREILVAELRDETHTVVWRGKDRDGRLLELLITLYSENDEETCDADEVKKFLVGTAYEPSKDDDLMRMQWLKGNPDWEEGPRQTARKKVVVERKR